MEPGKLKAIHTRKALEKLKSKSSIPHLTTTQALCAVKAGCGPVKFHRILESRDYAVKVDEYKKSGYEFSLPEEYGSPTYTINSYSFQWSPKGIIFISKILAEEKITFEIPEELSQWTK